MDRGIGADPASGCGRSGRSGNGVLVERKRQTGGALDWLFDHAYLVVPAQDAVGQFLATFRDYPQGQKGGQFQLG